MGRSGDGKRNILWGWPYHHLVARQNLKRFQASCVDSVFIVFWKLKAVLLKILSKAFEDLCKIFFIVAPEELTELAIFFRLVALSTILTEIDFHLF